MYHLDTPESIVSVMFFTLHIPIQVVSLDIVGGKLKVLGSVKKGATNQAGLQTQRPSTRGSTARWLRSFNICHTMLMFCKSAVASAIQFAIVYWGSG